MAERRRWPRHIVAWSARLVLGDGVTLSAKAVDASLHGLRVVFADLPADRPISPGMKCRVEVHLEESQAKFSRDAEVCHLGHHGAGLAIAEALPAALIPSVAAPSVTSSHTDRTTSVAGALRSIVFGALAPMILSASRPRR